MRTFPDVAASADWQSIHLETASILHISSTEELYFFLAEIAEDIATILEIVCSSGIPV